MCAAHTVDTRQPLFEKTNRCQFPAQVHIWYKVPTLAPRTNPTLSFSASLLQLIRAPMLTNMAITRSCAQQLGSELDYRLRCRRRRRRRLYIIEPTTLDLQKQSAAHKLK